MSEFKEKVDTLVSQMTKAEDGKWTLPEDVAQDLDEPTLFAVTSERRYRDTQAGYTKAQQEAKRQKAIAEGLQEHALTQGGKLSAVQAAELHRLKKENPDAWREKLNDYEQEATTALETELEEIATKSANKSELEIRNEQMAVWSESTGITLTDEVVENDLPPRFKRKLEAGDITFEEFLAEAGEFLKADKVIQGSTDSTDDDTLNLGKVAGGREPSVEAQTGDFEETYKKTIF